MKRIYIQQGETIDGKRKTKMIPIGHLCLLCKEVDIEMQPEGEKEK